MRLFLLLVAAVLAVGVDDSLRLHAQQPVSEAPAASRPVSEAGPSTRTVRIDAVVTDRQGRPILNLTPADFELVEIGVVQKIDAVEHAGRDIGPASPPPSASSIESLGDEERAAREPGTRVLAIVLDEFHVSAGASTDRVRAAAARFLDEQIRPNDLLAVLKPLDSITDIRFTRDREAAHRAIASFAGRKGDYTARTDFEQKYLGHAPAAVQAGRRQIVLSALRALTMKLGEFEADRAAIVLVSEGFTRDRRRDPERRVPDIQGLIRAASCFRVAIYALNPAAGDRAGSAASDQPDPAEEMLRSMASETGGEAVLDGNDMVPALQRVSRDLDTYYLLTYTSSHATDGRFYDVEVRAKRRDAQVRARSGYWAPLRSELLRARSEEPTPSRPARTLRRSPLIDTWLGLTMSSDGTHRVIFTWEPARITGARRSAEPATIALKISTQHGAPLFEGDIASARAGGTARRAASAVFSAPPGRIQMDFRILAADGSQIDIAASDIDVPDASRADPLILPPQVIRTSSAREFSEVSGNASAAPVPSREFRRTERLLLRVPTHSPSGSDVQVTARVVNRLGQVLRDLPPIVSAPSTAVPQFDVPLSWLAPGEYSIELTATNAAGTAKELIRIRVRG